MLSNLIRLPYKMMLESGDCTHPRFSPEYYKDFIRDPGFFSHFSASNPEHYLDALHPINRFFALLDPEMWELSGPTRQGSPACMKFPDSFLLKLFSYLSPGDLRQARGVCAQWNSLIIESSFWRQQLVGVVDGLKGGYAVGSSVANFVESSKIRWRFWNKLRIRDLRSANVAPILGLHASAWSRAVRHIKTLELSWVELEWGEFLELLWHFGSLKMLTLEGVKLDHGPGFMDKLMNSLGLQRKIEFSELLSALNVRCPPEDYFYPSLRVLELIEADDCDPLTTPLLLALLKGRTARLDVFKLTFGLATAVQLKSAEEQNRLFHSLHSFLGEKNVASVSISCPHQIPSGMVNRWMAGMADWSLSLSSTPEVSRLSELRIDLKPLIIWNSFERQLLPLVSKFGSLKVLALGQIVLRGAKSLLVNKLMDTTPPGCRLMIGIILDDQGGVESSNQEKERICSQAYQQNLVSLVAELHTNSVREIRDLLPYKRSVTYPSLTSLTVTTAGGIRPRFFTFNLNVLIYNFPNLTSLEILDGPGHCCRARAGLFSSCGLSPDAVWKDMSSAVMGDDEIQLVIKSLKQLRRLVLRANMKYVTDSGLTGFSIQYCRKVSKVGLSTKTQTGNLGLIFRDGVNFSNLQHLRHISIEGIGPNVTDVSAFMAFKEFGFKECLEDGQWFRHPVSNYTWSNYTTCVDPEEYQWRSFTVLLYEWGYILSVLALICSLLIFCGFKVLECTRVTIHKHLFASFIINNLLWLAWYRIVTGNQHALLREPWWCKGLHILVQYFLMANYFWMWCEGFYLHTLLVFAFIREDFILLRGFTIFGWLGPAIPVALYTAFRIKDSHEDLAPVFITACVTRLSMALLDIYLEALLATFCWTSDSRWGWILSVPVVISLGMNLGFLINILRVLITKLRRNQSLREVSRRNSSLVAPDSQYPLRKAVRATLILIPLLGLHYFLIPIRPTKGSHGEAIYDVVAAGASSLQGFCVSILFCFCNSEVISALKRKLSDCIPGKNSAENEVGEEQFNSTGPLPTSMSVVVIKPKEDEQQEDKC